MKQLLFTFFAIVLCYSLFFDNESRLSVIDEQNYIYEDASPDIYKDTLNFSTPYLVYNETGLLNPYFSDKKTCSYIFIQFQ
jgi:hypothetical protein